MWECVEGGATKQRELLFPSPYPLPRGERGLVYLAESEGLDPYGRCCYALALRGRTIFFDFLGLESLTLKPKNPPHGGFFGFGGERGIRTLDGATNPILP